MNLYALKPMPADEYHRRFDSDSHSSLELFRKSIPAYHAQRIAQTARPKPPTDEMELGTMVHTLVLEPDQFNAHYAAGPDCAKTTKAWRTFCALERRKVLSQDELRLATSMQAAIQANEFARNALEAEAITEETAWAEDPETGLALKCRPDRLLTAGICVDLKTTPDISPLGWGRWLRRYNYHCQAALYLDILEVATGHRFEWVWITVSKGDYPEAAVHRINDATLAAGRAENRRTLNELAECRRTDDWRGRYSREIHSV